MVQWVGKIYVNHMLWPSIKPAWTLVGVCSNMLVLEKHSNLWLYNVMTDVIKNDINLQWFIWTCAQVKERLREPYVELLGLPVGRYEVQVRCRSQNSHLWSKWSSPITFDIPSKHLPGKHTHTHTLLITMNQWNPSTLLMFHSVHASIHRNGTE